MESKKFNLMTLLLMPICIAINLVGGQVAIVLKLPIYIDVIGTVLAGILAGPFIGGITGLLSNVINSIPSPSFMPFAIVALAVGIAVGILSAKNMFSSNIKIIISVFIIAVISIIISTPIVILVFGGITDSGSSFFTALLLASGRSLLESVITSQIPLELLDKAISVIVSLFIISRLPDRYLVKMPLGKIYMKINNL